MSDADHCDNPDLILDLIQDSEVADTNPIRRFRTRERNAARWAWLFCKEVQAGLNAQLIGPLQTP